MLLLLLMMRNFVLKNLFSHRNIFAFLCMYFLLMDHSENDNHTNP